MNNHVRVPDPGVIIKISWKGNELIALDTSTARVIADENNFAGMRSVGDPYLVPSKEPVRVVRKIQLSPSLKG